MATYLKSIYSTAVYLKLMNLIATYCKEAKRFLSLLIIVVTVCACSNTTKSPYKPANNAGFGYKETRLADNSYRVEFKFSGTSKNAHSYALRRAAELTIEEGFDWFIVLKRDTLTGQDKKFPSARVSSRPLITRNCGLLGCRDTVHQMPDFGAQEEMVDRDSTAVLNIKMGKGVRPALENTYDAYETREKSGV